MKSEHYYNYGHEKLCPKDAVKTFKARQIEGTGTPDHFSLQRCGSLLQMRLTDISLCKIGNTILSLAYSHSERRVNSASAEALAQQTPWQNDGLDTE